MEIETATFAAGCFWGIEEAFRKVDGVVDVSVGYTGGTAENPTYEQVCTGTTGHAEAVQVVFDPSKITYEELLSAFWKVHDPTQLNRQGPDVGTQYRSAIFTHNDNQKVTAERSKEEEEGRIGKTIVTIIEPFNTYFPAEEYHQQYIQKRRR
jgi:peptide-methionine (S)-S-oxide reductase